MPKHSTGEAMNMHVLPGPHLQQITWGMSHLSALRLVLQLELLLEAP